MGVGGTKPFLPDHNGTRPDGHTSGARVVTARSELGQLLDARFERRDLLAEPFGLGVVTQCESVRESLEAALLLVLVHLGLVDVLAFVDLVDR